MHAPEASTLTDTHPDSQPTDSPAESAAEGIVAVNRVRSWGRRPRIGWLSQSMTGLCCNPGVRA
jgi:hypothetical protein